MIHDNDAYIRSLDRAERRRHMQQRSMLATILSPWGWPYRGIVMMARETQGRLDPSPARRAEARDNLNSHW